MFDKLKTKFELVIYSILTRIIKFLVGHEEFFSYNSSKNKK